MAQSFLKSSIANVVYGTTSSTASTEYSDQVDMANFQACIFECRMQSTGGSTGTATFSIVATDTSTAASTDYSSISGASVSITHSTTADQKRLARIEVIYPQHRYLKAKLVKKAKIIPVGITAIKYGPRVAPAGASTTLATAASTSSNVTVTCESTST